MPKAFDFSQVPFHQVTFDYSCLLLIDKANESCQNYKKFKKNAISPQKKLLKSWKGNSIRPAKTNASISQTSSKRLKLTIQT